MTKFNTNDVYIWNYGNRFLVECPKCKECAHVLTSDEDDTPEVRLSCTNCGNTKTWERKSPGITYCQNADLFKDGEVWVGAAVDWYFHLPLWLQISCCGNNLWAYNTEHLFWLKSFVSAKLRERSPNEKYGWSNQSLASRLPKWLKQGSNREPILSAISKLEGKVV